MKIIMLFAGMVFLGLPFNNKHYDGNLPETDPTPIAIRHDKADQHYIDLGKRFPAVGKIGERGGDGTLVAPQWVMTAAHVARGMFLRQGNDLKVYFENQPDGYLIDKIFLHPDFVPMQDGDIALIQLKERVQGVKLAQWYNQRDEVGKEIIIVGHGDFKNGNGGEWQVDGIKRGATNIIDQTSAHHIIFDFDEPADGTELEGTAGRGDSGGPAFIMQKQIPFIAGISSAGMPGKHGPGTYGAIEHYTRVSSYVDWINETIKNPVAEKALSKNNLTEESNRRAGRPNVRRGGGSPLPGLGLMLRQDNNQILIGGKADPMVPEAFRSIMFRSPSFLQSFNGKTYHSLEKFKKEFEQLDKGEAFTIQFSIQGKVHSFVAQKME